MYCPNCNSENSDSAKFCKKCGTPLKKTIDHQSMIKTINNEKSNDNTSKYIIIALIIIALALAGAFAYIGFGNNGADDSQAAPTSEQNTTVQASQPTQTSSASQSMTIYGGSFSTGSGLSDKTYANIYVGSEHAGEDVTIQIKYSRDGNSLNKGNMVPKTVTSDGYINVRSADAYKYYPDFATINIFDRSGNLLATQSVSLNPDSGTQYF